MEYLFKFLLTDFAVLVTDFAGIEKAKLKQLPVDTSSFFHNPVSHEKFSDGCGHENFQKVTLVVIQDKMKA